MKSKASRILVIFLIIQIVMSCIAPVTVYANDATMLEPLIEPNTKTYKVDVVSDSPGWFSKHYEQKYISFYNYYNSICSEAGGDAKKVTESLRTNPGYCMSMDDNVKLESYGGDGYSFFIIAEGYEDSSGNLINNDTEINTITSSSTKSFGGNKNDFTEGSGEGMKVLTFPAMHGGGAKDVTQAETEYAIEIGNTLSESLNSMLSMINGGKRYGSVSELVNKSILIRPTDVGYTVVNTGQEKNYVIIYGTPEIWGGIVTESENSGSKLSGNYTSTSITSSNNFAKAFANKGYPNADNNGNLLAYVIPIIDSAGGSFNATYNINADNLVWSELSTFVWAMPKGYAKIDGIDSSLKFTDGNHKEYSYVADGNDSPWITIHHISMYANNAYKNHNISIDTKQSSTESGSWIMTIIVEFFQTLLQGLRSVLGLSDMHTLVYNKGARSSSSWNYGAMNDTWWTVVLRYHLIFQSLAWFLIICGFIKILIDLNLSTINPGKRVSAIQTVQRFVVVGFLLVTVIPIIQFMLNMNSSIVQIFASQVDPNASEAPVIASLAGLVLQFAYFGICVYINFTYIMRSVIIGILTVTAPFFIASMAFSQSNKQLFDSWLREITANIFMQSIHAFSLAFLTNLVATGGGLESLVISYSIIPLTELVRTLVFQGAGSHASNLGMSAASKAINAGQSMVGALSSAGAGKAMDKLSDGDEKINGEGQGNAGGSGNMGKSSKVDQLSAKLSQDASDKKAGIKHNSDTAGGRSMKDNLSRAGLSAAKGALAMGNVMRGAMNLAVDMAGAEMSGQTAQYSRVGERGAQVAMEGGKAIGNIGSAAAEGAQFGVQAVGAGARGIKNMATGASGPQNANDPNRQSAWSVARTATGQRLDKEQTAAGAASVVDVHRAKNGAFTTTKLASAVGGTYTNDNAGGVNEVLTRAQLDRAAADGDKGGLDSGLHYLVQQSLSGNASAAARLKEMDVHVSGGQDNNPVTINYGRNYIKNSGFEAVSASSSGQNLHIRATGGTVASGLSSMRNAEARAAISSYDNKMANERREAEDKMNYQADAIARRMNGQNPSGGNNNSW